MTEQHNFKGFPPRPNLTGYSALPNLFFDEVLPHINNMSELKILLAVFRKTYGWVKEIDQKTGEPIYKLEDSISYSQFEELTGLSSTSIATGLNRAIQNGYLEKVVQGNYTGTVSSYRIVTNEDIPFRNPTPPVEKKKSPPITYFQMDNSGEDIKIGKNSLGTPLGDLLVPKKAENHTNLSKDKQDILADIFSTPQAETKPKEEKQKTPHQEFISNWFRCYFSKINTPYGNMTGKEHGHIKSMLKEQDLPTVLKAMEFYFENYNKLEGVPTDYPTITVFYAWRKKIIPSSINGVVAPQTKRNAREFDETKWKEDDFFDN